MYLFFDTETTGLPRDWRAPVSDLKNWPRVVQLAWLLFDREESRIAAATRIVKPEGFTIPAEATRIHGITTAQARVEGVALGDALREFDGALSGAQIAIAHNVGFDEKVIGAEFLRARMKTRLSEIPHFCTMESTTEFCAIPGQYGFKWPTLDQLHNRLFRISVENAHRAGNDVAACARCFFELKRRGIVTVAVS